MASLHQLTREARGTLTLAVPIMAGQLSQMLMGVADSVMVGRVGVVPLAASSFANSLLSVPFLFGIGLLQCISVRAAEAHGAGDRQTTGEVLRHGLALSVLAGLAMIALVLVSATQLQRFGQPPEVAVGARNFLILVGISMLPMFMAMSLRQFSEALNHPWPPMAIMLGSVLLNVGLNWIFIYGHLGAPAMGLDGAGLSTLLSRIAALVAIFLYVLRARRFGGALPAGWLRRLHPERLRSLLKIGLPTSAQLLLEVSAFAAAAIMMGWLGTVPLAAHQITLTCCATSFMFPLGIAMAATIRTSQALGAAELDRVRSIGLSSIALGALVMAACATLFALAGDPIARAFVDDREVTRLAATLLVVAAIFQCFDGVQVVAAGALRGLSDVTVPLLSCILAYWLLFLPFAYLAAFRWGYGPVGIWAGLAGTLALEAFLLVGRFLIKTGPTPAARFS
jgi:MATE family multidrug resistance protein